MLNLLPVLEEDPPGGHRHFAIARYKKSRWVGHNSYKTHPKLYRKKDNGTEVYCFHAEMHALLKVPKYLRTKIDLYVTRVRKNGELALSKPCQYCQKFLKKQGLKAEQIYYTNAQGKWRRLDVFND